MFQKLTKQPRTLAVFIFLSTFVLCLEIYLNYPEKLISTITEAQVVADIPFDCEAYCFDLDENKDKYRYYGSKAPYAKVNDADFQALVNVPNCTAVRIWSLFRHGTRTPTRMDLKELKMLAKIRDLIIASYRLNEKRNFIPEQCKLCDADLKLFKKWEFVKTPRSDQNQLAEQGYRDQEYLANSFRKAFPNLFEEKYSAHKYYFKYSLANRTISTYKTFVKELFGADAENIHLRPARIKDKILAPYLLCRESYLNSKGDLTDAVEFYDTRTFRSLEKSLLRKLGLKNADFIGPMWKMCQLEQSWNETKNSPWCAAFTPAQKKIMDYAEDIALFYMKSYGYKMNTELACATALDMMKHLESNTSQLKMIGYFVHSTMMYTFLATMGIGKDREPLRANNYYRMENRLFKSSEMVPFSANFAAIKYECPSEEESVKIMFLLNQKPLKFPLCTDNGLCGWKDVKQMFRKFNSSYCEKTFCTNITESTF